MADLPDYVKAIYTSVKNTWQDAENLDDLHGYVTYIWIPEETYKVDVMKLHIYSEKFRAYSKATSTKQFNVITSGGGGAAVKTSNYVTPNHTHSVTGATSNYVNPSHTHNVTGTSSTENESGYATFLPSLIGTKYALSSSERTTGAPSATFPFNLPLFQSCPNGHDFCQAYDVIGYSAPTPNHTHEIPSLETFIAIRSYMSVDVAQKLHTHDISGQTAESGGGNHRHTISGQTAESGGGNHAHTVTLTDHTHSVTIPNHTHGITFGIYEESIAGRTLSAILYDPNDVELEDFEVVLTGEDDTVLDLTDHFAELEYGMYKIVLSASGRLRARLVFYELCKMYAQY